MLTTTVQNPAIEVGKEEIQSKRPDLNLTDRKLIMEEAWGHAVERGYSYNPYHFKVYEDTKGSDECTAFISDPEGVSIVHFDYPEDAEDYCHELLGQPDWVKAIREGKPGIKVVRYSWKEIIG